ncbi:MAG TPA: rod shape-determining protein MreC [Cyclobacteriaceae bacterium]|nr:rod shape-determining protein MreC [Cyclobacteriaceae bacterium]HMV08035.1 rod shape-determining protein MreC [Cyclobacteriaceae bacterium]HMV88251.1 rod shape-determining protein MreC [Cyclobacteriaceae bacterium]HMX00675.1 rod shape-determining protein MreC [Cyclobacteriaceae bacterium]HMX49450.1 rod shape-determining protein MreC [Cyclobacteriaceae bacterium]
MGRIFLFIYQYRAFFTFLLLELFCTWLVILNNRYQGASFFNSANSFVASVNGFSQNTREYFSLRETNSMLAEENTALRKKLEQLNQLALKTDTLAGADSTVIKRFDFISAKVVNNSIDRLTNFITLNRGSEDGIKPGMAVISSAGVVGKIKITSEHFSVVTSVLNVDIMVSALMKRTGYFGTIQWDGHDPDYVKLKFIPLHVKPQVGDTIMTSGYSGVFPEGIMVGTIAKINPGRETSFHDLDVKLSQDFRKLSYATIIRSNLLNELDSLEMKVPNMQ